MTTESKPRIVIDTNVFISGIIFKGSALRRLLTHALDDYEVVFSHQTWDELAKVFQREMFEKNMPIGSRLLALSEIGRKTKVVTSTTVVTDCSDPKDNKFLSLALDAGASIIVTGDKEHLIPMHPYKGVNILTPADFLHQYYPS